MLRGSCEYFSLFYDNLFMFAIKVVKDNMTLMIQCLIDNAIFA